MRDSLFEWIKKYLIGFIVGAIAVVVCILVSQRAGAATNMYAWVTNGAGKNIYTGYVTEWEAVPVAIYSKPSDFYIIVMGEDGYNYIADMKNIVIKYK